MNSLKDDFDFYLFNLFDFSSKKLISIEVNDLNTQVDILNNTTQNTKLNSITINIDLSDDEYIDVKNFNEIINSVQNIVKTCKTDAQKKGLIVNNLKIVCCFYFSSIVSYEKAYYLFTLLNLSREFLFENFISTVFLFNTNYMNIFIKVADDLFSWIQYHFAFLENKNSLCNNFTFNSIYTSMNEDQLIQLEREISNHTNKVENSFILAYHYTYNHKKNIDKYLNILKNDSIYSSESLLRFNFIQLLNTKNRNKIRSYFYELEQNIEYLLKLDINSLLQQLYENELKELIGKLEEIIESKYPSYDKLPYIKAYNKFSSENYEESAYYFKKYFENSIDKKDYNPTVFISLFYFLFLNEEMQKCYDSITIYEKYKDIIDCNNIVEEFASQIITKIAYAYYSEKKYKISFELYYKSNYLKIKNKSITFELIDNYLHMTDLSDILNYKKTKIFHYFNTSYNLSLDLLNKIDKKDSKFKNLYSNLLDIYILNFQLEYDFNKFNNLYKILINELKSDIFSDYKKYSYQLQILSIYVLVNFEDESIYKKIYSLLEVDKFKGKIDFVDTSNYIKLTLFLLSKYNLKLKSIELYKCLDLLYKFIKDNQNYNHNHIIESLDLLNINPSKYKHAKKIEKVLNKIYSIKSKSLFEPVLINMFK
ncbi:hypothetical protein [Aliarcobacter butzleri]|uniref:hypothetical protein n=1 Tax=Aliarcobacter butzleri TaxID=28197 RepID=UPI0021B450CF|nr:hypothetical protein [Aliarcobacter butzleri]MCT7537108.1 hypothetical protein [Aliarcobacter butzleri]MCT7623588.1 hypothetical protein [Aliarcobacter butzleri]